MANDAAFWRNVAAVAVAHALVIATFVRINRDTRKSLTTNVVWMDAAAANVAAASSVADAEATPLPEATPESLSTPEEAPVLPRAKSEIEEAAATPSPTPSPTPEVTPLPTPKPRATPSAIATPKPKNKLPPKPSPKPKKVESKATPKPSPQLAKRPTPIPVAKEPAVDDHHAESKASSSDPGAAKTGAAGRDHAGGAGSQSASDTTWYGNMLHDRFHGAWVQPTSVVATGSKISALVRIRIEKDGRVSKFEILKPSGNVVVDESVAAVGQKVTQVDPLPRGVGDDHYEVNIKFELNPEQ